jgi:hypothetical protein
MMVKMEFVEGEVVEEEPKAKIKPKSKSEKVLSKEKEEKK